MPPPLYAAHAVAPSVPATGAGVVPFRGFATAVSAPTGGPFVRPLLLVPDSCTATSGPSALAALQQYAAGNGSDEEQQ